MRKYKSDAAFNRTQQIFGKCLTVFVLILGVFHLFQTYYMRYDSAGSAKLQPAELALAALPVAGVAAFLIYSRYKAPNTSTAIKRRVKDIMIPEQIFLIVFFLWQLICCASANDILSGKSFSYNWSTLLDIAISFFIFFPLSAYLAGNLKKISRILAPVLTAVVTVLMVYVLWNVFQNNVLTTPSGGIGMTFRLNLVISTHYNTVGAYASLTVLICIALAFGTTRKFMKPVYVLFALVHWIVLMLSQSRTSIIAAVFTLSVGVFIVLCITLKKRMKLHLRLIVSIAAAVVSAFVLMQSRNWVFAFFESISHLSEQLIAQGQYVADSLRKMELDNTMSARVDIWITALKIMVLNAKRFMFGTSPVGVIPMIDYVAQTDNGWYTHNQFLEMGVAFGVPGMLMYTGWLVLVARSCLRIGLANTENVSLADRILPLIVLLLVVCNLTEGMLIGTTYMPGCVFFLVSGWVCAKARTLPPIKIKELL